MKTSPGWLRLPQVMALGLMLGACTQAPPAPPTPPNPPAAVAADDAWEPGNDIAGKRVVINGVSQAIPAESAEAKRKMDAVYAEQRATIDELERKRLKNFSADADLQP